MNDDRPLPDQLSERYDARSLQTEVMKETVARLRRLASELDIDCHWQARLKSEASISEKLGRGSSVLDEIGIRGVVATVPQCFALLRLLHREFVAIPWEYDDYIANPKANGYQSIHTTIVAHGGHPVEVQLRTRSMHRQALGGSAAHYVYKRQGRLRPRRRSARTFPVHKSSPGDA